jgi:acetyl-CoA acetyltransferase
LNICIDAKGNEVVHNQDEGVRAGAKLEQMAAMKPLSDQPGAVITAASSSQICDGAAAVSQSPSHPSLLIFTYMMNQSLIEIVNGGE